MLTLETSEVVGLIEHAYDPRPAEDEWASHILDSMTAMTKTDSAMVMRVTTDFFDNGALNATWTGEIHRRGPSVLWTPATIEACLEPHVAEVTFGRTAGSSFSTLSGAGAGVPFIPGWRDCWREPIVDSIGIVSRDAHGDVIIACVGLTETQVTSAREAAFLTKIASHLGTADRLRRKPTRIEPDSADAVLDATGKLVHAHDERAETREKLDDGLARRTFAQKNREAPEKALEVWHGLVAGRWSLVDILDNDGTRFVLAMKNTPSVAPRVNLTPRERRVASLVATGHRDKEIAYTLGLSLASVSTAVRRARVKLGARSRADLASTWRTREQK